MNDRGRRLVGRTLTRLCLATPEILAQRPLQPLLPRSLDLISGLPLALPVVVHHPDPAAFANAACDARSRNSKINSFGLLVVCCVGLVFGLVSSLCLVVLL